MDTLICIYQGLLNLHQPLSGSNHCSLELANRYHYSIDRRRGFSNASEIRTHKTIDQQRIRQQITLSTFAFDYSAQWVKTFFLHSSSLLIFSLCSRQNRFVLIHSLNGKQFCTVTVWPQCRQFRLPFEVTTQDVLFHGDFLYIMPLSRSKTYQDVALLVFNVDTGLERARHRHSEAKRKHPLVFKESGEKRLYAFDQKLLQVLPSNEWTILVYKIQVESQGTSAILHLMKIIILCRISAVFMPLQPWWFMRWCCFSKDTNESTTTTLGFLLLFQSRPAPFDKSYTATLGEQLSNRPIILRGSARATHCDGLLHI